MSLPDWAFGLKNCAVTVCDADCRIIYMNERSRQTFAKHGDIIGTDLLQYHPERAQKIIRHLLATGETNSYTIQKNGQRKLIYQTPWLQDGKIAGLVELSMILPADLPHYNRD